MTLKHKSSQTAEFSSIPWSPFWMVLNDILKVTYCSPQSLTHLYLTLGHTQALGWLSQPCLYPEKVGFFHLEANSEVIQPSQSWVFPCPHEGQEILSDLNIHSLIYETTLFALCSHSVSSQQPKLNPSKIKSASPKVVPPLLTVIAITIIQYLGLKPSHLWHRHHCA